MFYRGTFAVVDLQAIDHNVRSIRTCLDAPVRLMAVVKANAYGHGAVEVARTVLAAGANDLGVASLEEALQLRAAHIQAPILVLGQVSPQAALVAARSRIAVTLGEDWSALDVPTFTPPLDVHLKVDTGMTRLGLLTVEDTVRAARWLTRRSDIQWRGFYTHLACADRPDPSHAEHQMARFHELLTALRADGLHPPLVHAANSAGTLRDKRWHHDMVRVGISLYGYPPADDFPLPVALEPALHLYGFATRVAEVSTGQSVGYGATFVAQQTTRVATVPVGYADGYPRLLSNRATAESGGARVPVIGRICMDQLTVDVSAQPGFQSGDCVTLYGRFPPEQWTQAALEAVPEAARTDWLARTFAAGKSARAVLSVAELARLSETISYEILCGLAPRVERVIVPTTFDSTDGPSL